MSDPQTWMRFVEVAWPGKTQRWVIETLTGTPLGVVNWYGPWRQYAFSPNAGTVFESKCLRDIAQFCESKTREYRKLPKLSIEQKVGG